MLKDFIPGTYEKKVYFDLNFDDGYGNGFCFPCDESGELLPAINEAAYENYLYCMSHPEQFSRFNKVIPHEYHDKIPAHGVCSCGNRIELYEQYLGACECPHCGRWYNLFGQELLPPNQWHGNYDY